MSLRKLLFENEKIVNQANYLLTTLTTLLIAVVSFSVQQNVVHAMFWPLALFWSVVFLLRLIEQIVMLKTTHSKSIKADDATIE